MTPYPPTLPADAVRTLYQFATGGLQPSGQPGDLGCVVLAGWNLLGYGLSLGVPCDHPPLGAAADARANLAALLAPALTVGADALDAPRLDWGKIVPALMQLLLILLAQKEPK